MSDTVDPKKLKVAELREELKQRGLDTKGNKPQLVKRLENALRKEAGGIDEQESDTSALDESALDTTTEDLNQTSERVEEPQVIEDDSVPEEEHATEDQNEPVIAQAVEELMEAEKVEEALEKDTTNQVAEESTATETNGDPEPEASEEAEKVEETIETDTANQVAEDNAATESNGDPEPEASEPVKSAEAESPVAEAHQEPEIVPVATVTEPEAAPADDGNVMDASSSQPEEQQAPAEAEAPKESVEAAPQAAQEEATPDAAATEGSSVDAPATEGDAAAEESAMVEGEEEDQIPADAEFQVMDQIGESEVTEGEDGERGQKRRRSRSRDRERERHHRSDYDRRSYVPEPMESDEWLAATNVQADRYNSDLNLRIKEDGYKCNPITVEGFGFMWAGCRATYGVAKGKVCFEVKLLEHLNVNHLPEEETSRHVVRVGWSTDNTSLQLGEEKLSYGYGGTAKASTESKFEDYGQTFGEGDAIGVYVDFESDPIEISYTKNGEDLDKCFSIEKETLGDNALFPHVLSKNSEFMYNFGQEETPFFPIKEGYTFINDLPEAERTRGSLPPEKKEDCEIIMMCGLPGCGKTFWANKHCAENPEKRFNIIGTNNIIDKMKVMGLPRKKNYTGRWDVLIDKSSKCLSRLLEIATKKKRNYILDQTNVYPSAQRRKMRPFEGFQRKAIVIVPTEEEFKTRVEKREKEEGKEVPDEAVLEMKANFSLPDEGQHLEKVEFIELEREEAKKLVDQYNKDAQQALPPEKRFRRDDRVSRFSGGNDNYRGGGSYRYNSRGGGDYRYNSRGGGDRYSGRDSRGYGDRRGRGRDGGYMGYSHSDKYRAEKTDYGKDKRVKSYDDRSTRNYGSSSWNKGSGSGWGGQQGSGGWGSQGGGWGAQASGGWGGQGGYQGNWGQQGGWGGQWGNQYQNQGSQNWGQNYNYNQGGWGNWTGYNQNQGWSGYGNSSYGNSSSSSNSYNQQK